MQIYFQPKYINMHSDAFKSVQIKSMRIFTIGPKTTLRKHPKTFLIFVHEILNPSNMHVKFKQDRKTSIFPKHVRQS